jgi:arabinofuranosyltransferase
VRDTHRVPVYYYLVVGMSLLLLLALEVWLINFTVDDPFISARYAANLVDGHGLVYNIGQRVEGYSNLSWVFVLAAGFKLGVSREPAGILLFAKIIGAILSLFNVLLVAKISLRLASLDERRVGIVDTIAVVFMCASFWYAAWSVGGLETQLYGFLLLCAAYFYIFYDIPDIHRKGSTRLISWSSLFYGLMGLTRPEFFFLFGGAFLHRLWMNRSSGEPFIRLVRWVLPGCIVCGCYFLWRHSYYGYWLPNTVYAKATGDGLGQYIAGLRYIMQALSMMALAVPLAFIFLPLIQPKPKAWYTFVLVQLMSQAAFIFLAGGDWMPGFRMFIPIIPFIGLCLQHGLGQLLSSMKKHASSPAAARKAFLLLTPILVLSIASHIYGCKSYLQTTCTRWDSLSGSGLHLLLSGYRDAAFWAKQNIPQDSLVATGEAGLIPYTGQFRLVDCLGLMDPHIAHLKRKDGIKFDLEYVMSQKPDYLILIGYINPDKSISSHFGYVNEITRSKEFKHDYRLIHQIEEFLFYERLDKPSGEMAK